jgi:hypothetical protein
MKKFIARYSTRACWYLSLVSLVVATMYLPTPFMASGVTWTIIACFPVSIFGSLFESIWIRCHDFEDYRTTFGIPTEHLGWVVFTHGVFLLVVYAFSFDILVARLGCCLIIGGIEMVLCFREMRSFHAARAARAQGS